MGKAMTGLEDIPFRVTELLCSRLCHDLISPVAAVSNGLELMADEDGRMDAEVAGLVGFSVGQAAGWLTLFRVAYGLGGENADALTLGDAGGLIDGVIEHEKISFSPPQGDAVPGREAVKLLLNMAILGLEVLPNRGTLSVGLDRGAGTTLSVVAEADGAALRPDSTEALAPDCDIEALTARSVQAYLTAWLARAMDTELSVESSPGRVELTARLL